MKTKNSLWKKKLVHTTMLMSALLIAATMITSAAIPVGTLSTQSSTPLKPIVVNGKQANAVSLADPADSRILSPMRTEGTLNTQQTQSPLRGLIWDNGLPDGVNGLSFGVWTGYNRELVDDMTITMPCIIQGGSMRMLTYSGGGSANIVRIDAGLFADVAGVPGTTEIYNADNCAFTAVNTGNTYFSRPEIKVTVTGLSAMITAPGTYWWSFQVTANPAENLFWLTAPKIGSQIYLSFPDYGYNRWTPGSTVFGAEYGISFELTGIPANITHDVGVSAIISPAAGNIQKFIPKATLMNNGIQDETGVQVDMNIDRWVPGSPATYFMNEAFGSWMPAGWTQTGHWTQRAGNAAGGTAPEAYLYYGTAVNGEFLMSGAVNTVGATTLKLDFRSFIDYYYPGDTYFYVETRANSGDSWTQRQPWSNPVMGNVGPALYDIDITSDIGTGTQVQFRFGGVPFDFDYWYVDNVQFFQPGSPATYQDDYFATLTVDIPMGTMDVTFPEWTPYGYQSSENVDIQFRAVATTYLVGDEIPGDDSATKNFIIHYPYLHDVGVDSIISPVTDGLGQAQVVKAVIKNYGQFSENWFNTEIQIGQEIQTNVYATDFEATNGGFTAAGSYGLWQWGTPTSGPGAAYSGTKLWATVLGGNYVDYANERLDSPAISVPAGGKLSYWHWFNSESYWDGYNVKVSVSPYTTWTLLGSYLNPYNEDAMSTGNYGIPGEPGFSGSSSGWKYIVMDLGAYAGQSIKIRFHFGSDSSVSSYPGAYIDDVRVYSVGVSPEYIDNDWQGQTGLAPGATREITFDTFVPDALDAGVSGVITYIVNAQTLLAGDTHSSNNAKVEDFTLTYVHDVTMKKINQPSSAKGTLGDVIFSQRVYTPDESWSFYTSDSGAGYLCQDDFWDLADPITDVEWVGLPLIFSGGWSQGNPTGMLFDIMFYTDAGGAPGSVVATFTDLEPTFEVGDMYAGAYQAYNWAVDLPDAVILADGWIGIQSHDAPDLGWMLQGGSPEGNLNALQSGVALNDNLAFSLTTGGGGGGHPPVTVYVKKGTTQPIQVTVNNVGTFGETVTANVALFEYVTEPVNGTQLYTDSQSGIALTPLGGESVRDFTGQLYALEGVYALYANVVPGGPDDVTGNNAKAIGIGSDGTAPVSAHTVTPAAPDGQNGWYVSDVTIKLTAADPTVAAVSSGVAKIEYQIDGGAWQTYTGTAGFKLTTDSGNHVVKYKATDKVGNVEVEKTIPVIKIDKTKPTISMSYNVTGGNALQGWELTFFVTANDATSGMAKVEFYFNAGLEATVIGAGPEYSWSYNFTALPNVVIKAIAYDTAGNNIFETIEDPTNLDLTQQSQQSHTVAKAIIR